jgi:hypothetical protein
MTCGNGLGVRSHRVVKENVRRLSDAPAEGMDMLWRLPKAELQLVCPISNVRTGRGPAVAAHPSHTFSCDIDPATVVELAEEVRRAAGCGRASTW